jgi:hypothetical protein
MSHAKAQSRFVISKSRRKELRLQRLNFSISYFSLATPIIASNHHLQRQRDKSLSL